MPNHDVYFDLYDRCDQTLEYEYQTTTNDYGVATWILNTSLEQKEYQLNVYTFDSYFMPLLPFEPYDLVEQMTDIDAAEWDSYTAEEHTTYSGRGTVYHVAATDSNNNNYIRFGIGTDTYDLSYMDAMAFDFYSSVEYSRGGAFLQTAWGDSKYEDNVDWWRLDPNFIGTIELYIDEMHFIHAVKYYFTPAQASETDYAETKLGDGWDFTEGDLDSWQNAYGTQNWLVKNGYLHFEDNIGSSYSAIRTENTVDFDLGYEYVIIRVKVNDTTDSPIFKIQQQSGASSSFQNILDTNYNIYVFDVSSWTGDYQLRISFDQAGSWTVNMGFEIDFIRLVHVDKPELIETDTNFYLSSSENMYNYAVYSDSSYLGTLSDLNVILKNNTVGNHNLTYVLYSASEKKAYLEETYVNTYVTSNYDGSYIVYEDGSPIDSGTLHKEGTTIITNRDVTPGASINYTIAFTSGSETVTFQTYYNNPSSDFFVTSYSVDIDPTITVTWDTSKSSIDSLTVIEDGVTKVSSDTASPTSWSKSTVAGEHYVTLIFSATEYNDILYSFVYTVAEEESFSISVESFYLSDTYVNTYVTSNYDYDYYIYEDNEEKWSGSGNKEGTAISSIRNTTEGVTIDYAIKFVNGSDIVWFNTSYSNALSTFYVETYSIDIGETDIEITWDTSKDSIDSLTIIEDGILKVNTDPTSPTSWVKSSEAGEHYVTLIFSATEYNDILYSFVYTVTAPEALVVSVENFYVTDFM